MVAIETPVKSEGRFYHAINGLESLPKMWMFGCCQYLNVSATEHGQKSAIKSNGLPVIYQGTLKSPLRGNLKKTLR